MAILRAIWRLLYIFADNLGRLHLGAADKWWMAAISVLFYAGLIAKGYMRELSISPQLAMGAAGVVGIIVVSTIIRRKQRVRHGN